MKYKEYEIDISTANYSDRVAIIPLSDGSIICIPEENATGEEKEVICQIKEDVAGRSVEEVPVMEIIPTTEERISALETLALQLGGVI